MEVKRPVAQTVRLPLETLCWAQLAEERMCHGARRFQCLLIESVKVIVWEKLEKRNQGKKPSPRF